MCSIEKSKINRAIKKSRINKAIEKSRVNRAIEKSRINRAIEKSRINRPIVELSRKARSTSRSTNVRAYTHNEIDKTIVNAHSTTPFNLMILV
jgi:hypothetical protein